MYYRFNHVSYDASRKEEFLAKADTLKGQMADVPGLKQVLTVEVGEGKLIIMGVYDQQDSAKKATETVQKMMPNASVVKFSPMIASSSHRWINEPLCQDAWNQITRLIEERNHVTFDSFLPRRNRWMDKLGTHIRDPESVQFFTEVFKQI